MKTLLFTKEEKEILLKIMSSFNEKDYTFKEGSAYDRIEKKLGKSVRS